MLGHAVKRITTHSAFQCAWQVFLVWFSYFRTRPCYGNKANSLTINIWINVSCMRCDLFSRRNSKLNSNKSFQYSWQECRYNKLKTRTIISTHHEDNLALRAHINSVISLDWSCNLAFDVAMGIVGSHKMVQQKYFHLDQFAISHRKVSIN